MRRSDLPRRPTLLNSCAMAATAAEARFRIGYPFRPRDSRILAVDAQAAVVVCWAAQRHWAGAAHFLTVEPQHRPQPGGPEPGGQDPGAYRPGEQHPSTNGSAAELTLRSCDGDRTRLSDELAEADIAVMVASSAGARAAAAIGRACAEHRVMTAGFVLADQRGHVRDAAVLALRPYAMVLVVSRSEDDLLDLLTALRA
jgi:hypothetical protein